MKLINRLRRHKEAQWLKDSYLPTETVENAVRDAKKIIEEAGDEWSMPPALWIKETQDKEFYGYTKLLYSHRGFIGAEIHLRVQDALVHELIHVLTREATHQAKYKGKVKYWDE